MVLLFDQISTRDSILALISALLVGYLAFTLFFSKKLKVSGPGIRQYLPGGLVYPMIRDQRTVTRTIDSLSRKYGDVFQMRFGPYSTLVTSVPEDIAHVFSLGNLLPKSPNIMAALAAASPGGLLSMEEQLHKSTRRTLRDTFNYSMLENFHPEMVNAVIEVCDVLNNCVKEDLAKKKRQVIDISKELGLATFRILTNVAFGFSLDRNQRLELSNEVDIFILEIMKEYVGYPIRQALTPIGNRKDFFKAREKIRSVCHDFVFKRMQELKEEKEVRTANMLDSILSIKKLTTSAQISMAVDFTVAGAHSSSQLLAWTIYEVSKNPHVIRRIDEELSLHLRHRPLSEPVTFEDMKKLTYFFSIWKEVLRLHMIGVGVLRIALVDLTLRGSGTFVPKGTLILAHIARAQTHERIWEDALLFNPDRWESNGTRVKSGCYVPFGVGQRACAGQFLADYEGPLILVELYRRFRFELACDPQDVVNCSCFVDTPLTSSKVGGPLDRGVPVYVSLK